MSISFRWRRARRGFAWLAAGVAAVLVWYNMGQKDQSGFDHTPEDGPYDDDVLNFVPWCSPQP